MFPAGSEIPADVPVMHEVMLSEKDGMSEKGGSMWSDLMPLTSYVVPETKEGMKDVEAALEEDPLLGVTVLGAFAELTLLPEVKRRIDLRRERREAKKKVVGDNAAINPNALPRRLATAVMISMPSREQHNTRTRTSLAVDDEQTLPEVVLGTCTRMVYFDTKNPSGSDGEVAGSP